MSLRAAIACCVLSLLAWPAEAQTPLAVPVTALPSSGVHGGPLVDLKGPCRDHPEQTCAGEIDGVFDFQGGDAQNGNLNIGASGRGFVIVNPDIGAGMAVYDGQLTPGMTAAEKRQHELIRAAGRCVVIAGWFRRCHRRH